MSEPHDTALKMAVMWHGVAFLPRLREMDPAHLRDACVAASDLSGARVLHMQPDASSREFTVPSFAWKAPLSGAQVIALMVFGLWVLCSEREGMCSGLVEAWPIRDALVLSPRLVAQDNHESDVITLPELAALVKRATLPR